jgi:hypothetical protein
MEMRPIAWGVLLALVSGACTRQRVTVTPRGLFRAIPELRSSGRATIEVSPSGTHELASTDVYDVRFSSCAVFGFACEGSTTRLTVASLIANCPDIAPFANDPFRREPPCLLLETTTREIQVDSRIRPNWEVWKIIGGALLASLVIGVVIGYVTDCSAPDDGC